MSVFEEYTIKHGDTLSDIASHLGFPNWRALLTQHNSAVIRQAGLEWMRSRGYGPNVSRGPPCGINGHVTQSHEIRNGQHFDNPGQPTIYPGDILLFEKYRPEPEEPEPEEEEEEETTQNGGKVIQKTFWTGLEYQTPTPRIEIFLPSNKAAKKADHTFEPFTGNSPLFKLLGYTFSESVDDLDGSFSCVIESGEINGINIFDIIELRSVVKIYEGHKHPVFVGIVRRRKFSKQMTSGGIKKTINFSGKSITSCVSEYSVSLDVRIYNVGDSIARNNDLKDRLRNTNSIIGFMETTWEHFKTIVNVTRTTKLSEIIEKYMGKFKNFVVVGGAEHGVRYNIAGTFYNASTNRIADVWRHILPKAAYELFSRCENGQAKIIVRQKPFGDPEHNYSDWKNLDMYVLSPISITGYELEQNDDNVYTAFASYVVGSARSREFYLATNRSGTEDRVRFNREKAEIYGFRPLEITFMGYDRSGNTAGSGSDDIVETLQALNELAAYWHSRDDEMYSGTITLCTDFKQPETNPRVGCRAEFLGGEFYITKAEHTWKYEATPTIKLTVSRGMKYGENGRMINGNGGVLNGIATQYKELERHREGI